MLPAPVFTRAASPDTVLWMNNCAPVSLEIVVDPAAVPVAVPNWIPLFLATFAVAVARRVPPLSIKMRPAVGVVGVVPSQSPAVATVTPVRIVWTPLRLALELVRVALEL